MLEFSIARNDIKNYCLSMSFFISRKIGRYTSSTSMFYASCLLPLLHLEIHIWCRMVFIDAGRHDAYKKDLHIHISFQFIQQQEWSSRWHYYCDFSRMMVLDKGHYFPFMTILWVWNLRSVGRKNLLESSEGAKEGEESSFSQSKK